MNKTQRKVVISAAITGAIHTPSLSPYLPATPEQIVQNAVDAAQAGAAVIHIHGRNENGEPSVDPDILGKILSEIKSRCNAVIGITTGGGLSMTTEERFSVLERFQPEMASANCGSMNFCLSPLAEGLDAPLHDWEVPYLLRTYDSVFKNTLKDFEYCVTTMNRCGTFPEFEVFDYGQLNNLLFLLKKGVIKKPVYIQFVPGVLGGMPISIEGLMFMIDQAKKLLGNDILFCSVTPGRRMFRLATLVAINGGNVRVGLEDGLNIKPSGELAVSNAAQVSKIKAVLELLDFEIASPDEAREQFGLKGPDKVAF